MAVDCPCRTTEVGLRIRSNELLTELNRVAEALRFIPLVAIHGFLNASVPIFHPQKQYAA
jgi:hypothetical protein